MSVTTFSASATAVSAVAAALGNDLNVFQESAASRNRRNAGILSERQVDEAALIRVQGLGFLSASGFFGAVCDLERKVRELLVATRAEVPGIDPDFVAGR